MKDAIHFLNQEEFIEWLDAHHDTAREIWVVFSKLKSNSTSLTWSESVDCALAFGWIDGIRKSIDDEHYKIRFTPRNPNSVWSKVNVQKAHRLIKRNQMRPSDLTLFNN